MYDTLKKLITEINDDDLRTMFGTVIATTILSNLESAEDELNDYLNYEVPVSLGDIVDFQEKQYIVTCVYTDNSVDLLGDDATKRNVGLYKKVVTVVGELEVIQED